MQSLEETRAYFEDDRYATKLSGIVIEDIAEHYALCRMPITEDHKNALGAVMGGAIYTLADFTFAVAANQDNSTKTVTLSSQIIFLSGSKGSELTAEAKFIKDGRTNCFYEVSIRDDLGKDIAVVTFTGAHVTPKAKQKVSEFCPRCGTKL